MFNGCICDYHSIRPGNGILVFDLRGIGEDISYKDVSCAHKLILDLYVLKKEVVSSCHGNHHTLLTVSTFW